MENGPHHSGAPVHPLIVHQDSGPVELGANAGARAVHILQETLAAGSGPARVLLAAAPSQRETLRTIAASTDVDFGRMELFQMDDYIGLPSDAPQCFGNWLEREFVSQLPKRPLFHRMEMDQPPEVAAARYAQAIGEEPFDLVLCGLGENAHIAFNEPGCDFTDPEPVRVIAMDTASRQQQVNEGHFTEMAAVPTHALTVTIPRVLHSAHHICSVPGEAKREAVRATLELAPSPEVPGTALKLRPGVHLYLDVGSDPR